MCSFPGLERTSRLGSRLSAPQEGSCRPEFAGSKRAPQLWLIPRSPGKACFSQNTGRATNSVTAGLRSRRAVLPLKQLRIRALLCCRLRPTVAPRAQNLTQIKVIRVLTVGEEISKRHRVVYLKLPCGPAATAVRVGGSNRPRHPAPRIRVCKHPLRGRHPGPGPMLRRLALHIQVESQKVAARTVAGRAFFQVARLQLTQMVGCLLSPELWPRGRGSGCVSLSVVG